MQGAAQTYREAGVDFEPRWFGLLTLLRARETIEIGEAAAELGQSHVAVVQVANQLEERKLIRRTPSKEDGRRRALVITAKGEALCEKLEPIWNDIRSATDALLAEAAPHFLAELDALDQALTQTPHAERIRAARSKREKAK